jgi:class 3 adenylate cyclase
MNNLRDWLREHKLEQYAETFEANDIDLDILSELTDSDLERLGVSLGNRRRLLRTISGDARSVAQPGPQAAPAPTPRSNRDGTGDAERRQVTVMFCDLVGSTALSGAVDPELLGALIRHYQDATAGVIARFDGFLAKFMGDGVLAYFGFPRAHEDAAERAVHAALAIIVDVGRLSRPDGERLQARIGIATGLVVVGEIVGSGVAQERTIIGETPNLAARLQALAEPDTILISDATQHLLGNLFEIELTGTHQLKGFPRSVPAWRVLREAPAASRFAAIRAGGNAPFIGRANEMGLALERWRLARQGEGQVVTVIGEPGLGKSRILQRLEEELTAEPHRRVHLQCSPYYTDSAIYPVTHHLGRAAGINAADPPNEKLEKLRTLFAERVAREPAAIGLLADILSLPVADSPSSLTPAQRKEATLSLLIDEIIRLGDLEPVLLVLEDAQWIDATTLELMSRLIDSIGSARFLIMVTARPDFIAPWQSRSHASLLTLGRLSREDCLALVTGVAAAQGLPPETIDAIVARTDGVPLFAEEMTKTVMESAGGDPHAVPATLSDTLMARLDRLEDGREVAQIAAVIGRQFSLALLEDIYTKDAAALETALSKLLAAGIVFPQGRGLERGFSFKHALVRDAAYESLLLARRREWHERIARALEQRFPEIAANEPELLAHHFGGAGLAEPACDYRMRAGDRAMSRSAYKEAVAHFSAGLNVADGIAVSTDRMRHRLDFLLKLGAAQTPIKGAHATEVEEVYRRASEIGEIIGDQTAFFKAKWGLWLAANMGRKSTLARNRAKELVALAERSGDNDLLFEAHHCRWSTAFFNGEVVAALDESRIGAQSYDPSRHRHLGPTYGGHDPGVCAHGVHALALRLRGERLASQDATARAIALAEMLDHPYSIAHALTNAGMSHQVGGDRAATYAVAERMREIAEKFSLPPPLATSLALLSWVGAAGSGAADAANAVDAEIDKAIAVGPLPQWYLGLAGEVLLAAGRPADGIALLDRGLAMLEEPGVGFYLPEIYRLRGQCLLAIDRSAKAQAQHAFIAARDIARQQGATIFLHRAEACLADL